MNAVEIADAFEELAKQHFNPNEFPFEFLRAFDNSETTIRRLRASATNKSDTHGAILHRNNIHILVNPHDKVSEGIKQLKKSLVKQMKAGEVARTMTVAVSDIVHARNNVNMSQSALRH